MPETVRESLPPNVNRDAFLRVAKASPEVAGQHDKQAWLDLYAEGAIVEDPVGTQPSQKGRGVRRGGDELGRFYDAFILQSDIRMVPTRDIVCQDEVFRAVTIHTTNRHTGLEMQVPANLIYRIVDENDQLRIARMHAHWELNRMSRQIMGKGLKGAATIAVMNYSMLRAFGPSWVRDYFGASRGGVRRAGKEAIQTLAAKLGEPVASSLFTSTASVILPGLAPLSVERFLEGCTELVPGNLIASGDTVSGLISFEWGGRRREGALRAELDASTRQITELRLYWDC